MKMPPAESQKKPRRYVALAIAAIVASGLAAYSGSFHGAFVYDDLPAIVQNPTIRRLWPITRALSPAQGSGLPVQGRPLVNLSFAANYVLGGTQTWGYHALNLGIHLLAALTLFALLRRSALSPAHAMASRADKRVWDPPALLLPLAITLLWALHPLQTESVTYLSQRAESLMGLFYLLTLYCFVRGWLALAVVACAAGMASKEVMVSAPLIVLLYDRAFVAGSFSAALRRRRRFYAGLASTWILLACLVWRAGSRGGTAGFGTHVPWWAYALTQLRAVTHYLRLSVWPHPLVFDYGPDVVRRFSAVAPQALCIAALAAATVYGLWRRPRLGFLGAWFFALLAPSSSVVPVATEIIAEHRMYLALAAVMTAVALALQTLGRRAGLFLCFALAAAFGVLTCQRNLVYRSELALWTDTAAKAPGNARAHFNLGVQFSDAGRTDAAIAEYREALQIMPDFASAHANLANMLFETGSLEDAGRHAEQALRINPGLPEAHEDLGNVLFRLDRIEDALREYAAAVRLKPDRAEFHSNLGAALSRAGQLPEAEAQYRQALGLEPGNAELHYSLGNTLALSGKVAESISEYEAALRLRPDFAAARKHLELLRSLH